MASTPASMLRIVTEGLQDRERLNTPRGQPSTKFYSAVLRRRTRWASQWRRVDFDNLADFGKKATVTLPILGELITRVTLVVEMPDLYTPQRAAEVAAAAYGFGGLRCLIGPRWSWTNAIGHALCSEVEFKIGDQIVDRLDSRLLEVIDEQTRPVEHWDSTNAMIARDPTAYSQMAYEGVGPNQQRQQTLEIVFPFWFNRGPGPQALPIQALANDKVQITVDFRTVQECVYSDARVNPLNPGFGSVGAGPLLTMAGCGFYQHWPAGDPESATIYDMSRVPMSCGAADPTLTPTGRVLPGHQMPKSWHFRDAYWIVEYVSLEDREAAAFRMADLQIPMEQHVAVPVTPTNGAQKLRIPLTQNGLVRDMSWVAQRTEAPDYNAYFLFSRDLAPPGAAPSTIPWWPDTRLPDWDYGDGYIRPGFVDRRSDPIVAATLWTQGVRRFDLEGPSFFRSFIPALGSRRAPLIDRYIYRYDFGFWPTGGLEEALELPADQPRGYSNWVLNQKELALTMNHEGCTPVTWIRDASQPIKQYVAGSLAALENDFSPATAGFQVTLVGAGGVMVSGIVDYQAVRSISGFSNLYARANTGGSAALVAVTGSGGAVWIAVAGARGASTGGVGGTGGSAGTAVSIGEQGGPGVRAHAAAGGGTGGGGGGGRGPDPITGAGVGSPDGIQMPLTAAFALSHQQTGGTTNAAHGGDGWAGGGSGSAAGGGGGSYVSRWITGVNSGPGSAASPSFVLVMPMKAVLPAAPTFNIYVWLTTYNLLRITGGRGALMFSA